MEAQVNKFRSYTLMHMMLYDDPQCKIRQSKARHGKARYSKVGHYRALTLAA